MIWISAKEIMSPMRNLYKYHKHLLNPRNKS